MSREMKDSGIPWIGEIPENWEVKRLKQESIFINGFAFDSEDFKIDEGVRVIRIGDIGLKADFENCVRAITNSSILKPYRIEDGDILIAMSGATTGKCCIVDKSEEAYINQRVGIIRSDIRKIIYYSLQTPYFMEFVNLNNAGSAQPNISSKAIGEFPILSIPTTEQQKIASFLDRKCSEVDEMIALQEQIVEELNAYKQSVITEAVTKGLNPYVPMKDSGIEWIGEIPKEWHTCQVKNIFTIARGRVIPITEMDDSYHYPVYSSQTKDNGCMGYIPTFDYEGEALTWTTDGANAGTVFYRVGKFNCTNICGVLQLKTRTSFITYMLYSVGHSAFHCRRADTNGYKIMSNEMAEIKIAVPPLVEQHRIAEFLDRKCSEIDKLIAIKQSKIDSLNEYKKSIIYEYVTGKKEIE